MLFYASDGRAYANISKRMPQTLAAKLGNSLQKRHKTNSLKGMNNIMKTSHGARGSVDC
jgi:hypothetical protein